MRGNRQIVVHQIDSEEDSDYAEKDDSGDDILDDIIFRENIDNVEWAGLDGGRGNEGSDDSSDSSDEDQLSNESDFESAISSQDENQANNSEYVFRQSQVNHPTFFLEQIFSTKQLFKDAVNSHSVNTGRSLRFTKNDQRRIYIGF
ncbi:hypothetical protein OROMI_030967 [Orobanche minor]